VRLRPEPAVRYVHPRAIRSEGEWNLHVDIAEDSAPNHLHRIAALCRPHLGPRVLDVGAGTGAITQHLAQGREVVAVELSDWCVRALERRFADAANVTVAQVDLHQLRDERGFDAIVMINVLEHLRDDVGALSALRGVLHPGGRVVIYVPAMNWLYTGFDSRIGHYRRYAKWRLRAVVKAVGLHVVELRYLNALAIPAWLLLAHSRIADEPGGGLALWDRVGVPVGRVLDTLHLPVGLNLFCVAR
jgi:SAM-dependent methyltransferase